ncbi:MAG: MarR family transcriptional regulator [Vulcanimicrobiota bacterium]
MFSPLPVHEEPETVRLRTWVQLARTYYRMEQTIAACLASQGLTLAQFDVLASLHYCQGVTQKELAETLLVTKGNVVGLLDRLTRLQWVERRPDPNDGRSNRVHLTESGRRKIESVLPLHDQLVLRALACLEHNQVVSLRASLSRLEQSV